MAKERQIVELPEFLTVRELATLTGVSPIEVMKRLISNGVMATINQQIEFETAAIVLEEMGFEARAIEPETPEVAVDESQLPQWRRLYANENPKDLQRRPPVVTILGHVDHGKTTLLDVIREANVADGEAGGITQRIGAYQITREGKKITFLDTPGHEAFTAMRARGAQGADIVILVVAADDGVMPTTKEALAHARAAHVPIVVAITKVDKRNANVDRVKQQLSELELTADDWGGTTYVVPVSAREKKGIDDLLEAILIVAEEAPISANPKSKASGTVVEAEMDKSRGALATLLVQNGTLRTGDTIVVGMNAGRVRAMFDQHGKPLKEAPPSTPVRIMGMSELSSPGETFMTFKTEREARAYVEGLNAARELPIAEQHRAMTLEELYKRAKAGDAKELLLIIKVDQQGLLEPIAAELNKLKTEEIGLRILLAETGNISESDINLAITTRAIVIGFNVDADNAAHKLAEGNSVEIRSYTVIYALLEDVEKAMKGMLDPVYADKVIGVAEVRKIFKIPKIGKIAGSIVREGEIRRNAKVRVRRGRTVLADGLTVGSLKRETEDVREVRAGIECGIAVEGFEDFIPGDHVEFLVRERVS